MKKNKTKKPKLLMNGHTDEIYTPNYAIKPLLPYLKREWIIWDSAFGSGKLAEHFIKEGFNVVGKDSIDFLDENLDCDVIITNPPYSKKEEFIKRCYELEKPFALLMPLTALEGKKRGELYRKNGIQLLVPNKRINFVTPNNGKSSWFATAWFCWKLNLPKDLMFVELERTNSSIPPTTKVVGILEATL
jgi:hypothetical protein